LGLLGRQTEALLKAGRLMPDIVDWQQPPRRHRRLFFLILAILTIVIFSSRTALSYYVDALWFASLGYGMYSGRLSLFNGYSLRHFLLSHFFFYTDGSWH
jgi:hypothetical protein